MKKMILLVDDMEEVYRKIAPYFSRDSLDYSDNKKEALEKINQGRYKGVITDFELGKNDLQGGLEIIAAAKKKGLPVLSISRGNHKEEVLKAGADIFMFKKDLFVLLKLSKDLNLFQS